MTDTTIAQDDTATDLPPCTKCGRSDHTTKGHHESASPDSSPLGHHESSVPTGSE